MCGISAIVTAEHPDLAAAIGAMVSVMHHRGPDGRGSFIDPIDGGTRLALGHNRLSIIDLSDQAAQPMTSLDGRYVLVFNGEVYNYKEIAQELDRRELPPGTCGDTAVILAALARWGPPALAKFNGMWTILLYDRQAKTLLVSRDRFGVKPLYVYRQGRSLYFASEVKAILAASGASLDVDPKAAVPYLTRGLLNFSSATFFRGVEQFPPASYQLYDLRRWQDPPPPQRYWQHPLERGEEPAVGRVSPAEVRETFVDAVRLRLRSDVPVGLLLSGGVDSSAILGGIASLKALDNLTVLSVTSDDRWANEEPFIDLM